MSLKITRDWHILKVLADSSSVLFDCIVTHIDKGVRLSIAEVFTNIADRNIDFSKVDGKFFDSHIESVKDLCLLGASSRGTQSKEEEDEDRQLLRTNVSLVQTGLRVALSRLSNG